MDLWQVAAEIKGRGREAGFDRVGIAPASPSAYNQYLREWLDGGAAGEMNYLLSRFDQRTDVTAYFPGARSVICVAVNYHVDPPGLSAEMELESRGKIARYARGDDYHEVIKARLYQLADWIKNAVPGAETRCGVDTAPIMEKELAARAGVGWMGKNTCIIDPEIGSWLLLGEIITTLDLPFDQPAVDRCGSCTRCIDACPTTAITAPYQLDPRRCISYLTIEHRGDIATDLQQKTGDWIFGCDICQDVCPYNRRAPQSTEPAWQSRFEGGSISLPDLLKWSQPDYAAALRHSAMKRVKLPVLQRNARIALQNKTPPARP